MKLEEIVESGFDEGCPDGPARLGYFEVEEKVENADNVFVLVVHYDFKSSKFWHRVGDNRDVENLRETFAVNRNCKFRDMLSPKKEDLITLLGSEQKIMRFFACTEMEPSVFIFVILSHGGPDGKIFTDTLLSSKSNDFDSFKTKDLFKAMNKTFQKSMKFLFYGPCRGQLDDEVYHPCQSKPNDNNDLTQNRNSCKVSFHPKMRNLVIFYATVETTTARRDCNTGTWMVKYLCEELNGMKKSLNVLTLLTAVHSRIDKKTTECLVGQTPELKVFPMDRKFVFHRRDSGNVEDQALVFNWWNPKTKTVLRGRRAVIFHEGKTNEQINKLESALVSNLGFETIIANITRQGLNHYFSKLDCKSWSNYGCFAAFFFAEVVEQEEDGQICIRLSGNEIIPIGDLIHGLLGPKNDDWIGKPKLFFLINQKHIDSDGENMEEELNEILQATNHSGWLAFILRDKEIEERVLSIFDDKGIKSGKNLQDFLDELLINAKDVIFVSTLSYLLTFPELDRHFVAPNFLIKLNAPEEEQRVEYKKIIELAQKFSDIQIWLMSSLPGSGKSMMMREIAFDLQMGGREKVFSISFLDVYDILSEAERNRRKYIPSLAFVVAKATGNRELEIQNLIEEKKIIVMFDGFDEICPEEEARVLEILSEAAEKHVRMWISTRPHEENTILEKLKTICKICVFEIMPLNLQQQTDLLAKIFKGNKVEHQRRRIMLNNGLRELRSNPLHLKMIAEISESVLKDKLNVYDIYEAIVQMKVEFSLSNLEKSGPRFKNKVMASIEELEDFSAKFIGREKVDLENLQNKNNGIVTFRNNRVHFVHLTFAEFLAAGHYISCLFKNSKMPFDILKKEYLQVRLFVDMKLSSLSKTDPELIEQLEMYLMETLTKPLLCTIIISENLKTMFSVVAKHISFKNIKTKGKLHFSESEYILKMAFTRTETIALRLLELGAFESLIDPSTFVVDILGSVINKKFLILFTELEKKCQESSKPLKKLVKSMYSLKSIVEWVAAVNNYQMLQLLFEGGLCDALDAQSLFKSAVQNYSEECAKFIIGHTKSPSKLISCFNECKELTLELVQTFLKKDPSTAAAIFKVALNIRNFERVTYLHEKYDHLVKGTRFENGESALHILARRKGSDSVVTLEMCQWLIDEVGIKIGDIDKFGQNAIHLAAKDANWELVKYFLNKDLSIIEALSKNGENLMHFAIQCEQCEGCLEMVKFLHDLNGNLINHKTNNGETVLHFAAKQQRLDLFQWLLENGAILNAVDNEGWNALHIFASSSSDLKAIDLIHAKSPEIIKSVTNKGENAMHLALQNQQSAKIVKHLHKLDGELVQQKTKVKETMCHYALRESNSEICMWLVENGAFANEVNKFGRNVLHVAAYELNLANVQRILEKYPTLTATVSQKGENAMHLVCKNPAIYDSNCVEMAKYLHNLDSGLIKQKTKSKKTMLHLAAKMRNFHLCKWLIENGVDVDAVTGDGFNSLHFFAIYKINVKALDLIVEKSPSIIKTVTDKGENAMHLAVRCWDHQQSAKIAKHLHKLDPDLITQKTKSNETVLHLAANARNFHLCLWLIENGADVHAEDNDGWNVLHIAAYRLHFDFVEIVLKKHPALIKTVTKQGKSVIQLAQENPDSYQKSNVLKFLYKHLRKM
ncbi:uncharacterized protein LOC132204619 [Neocloeon triangulifer]|uniref:uncharacterized protein LOC132204619 n=1 Tax=Neocloeon triangulifer TaxID=2078957 RepID=UPI00286EFAA1|nr:uncharacterized protein LOC132204619 [Neocloeon triangulifer]XP_059489224.1 uncharacterized protein LOC132204619 [Neocloeon triangulifer]